jgi:DNA-binding transcriptional LysR family regulator
MQAFVHVAETGSFADSARHLGIARSVMSERVKQLETLLNGQLLHRSTRSVVLSELGESLLPEYRSIVHRIGDLENAVPALRQSLAGRLRIASVTDLGIHVIAPIISAFARQHPELAIDLITENRVINPIEGGFDIAFHVRQGPASDVDETRIADVPSVYCAAPSYLARSPAINLPGDLKSHACVNYSFQPNINEWLFHREGETVRVNVPFRLSSNSGQVLHAYAIAGHGVAVLPRYRINSDLSAGRLIEILPAWHPPKLLLTATIPRSHRHTHKVQLFLQSARANTMVE